MAIVQKHQVRAKEYVRQGRHDGVVYMNPAVIVTVLTLAKWENGERNLEQMNTREPSASHILKHLQFPKLICPYDHLLS